MTWVIALQFLKKYGVYIVLLMAIVYGYGRALYFENKSDTLDQRNMLLIEERNMIEMDRNRILKKIQKQNEHIEELKNESERYSRELEDALSNVRVEYVTKIVEVPTIIEQNNCEDAVPLVVDELRKKILE